MTCDPERLSHYLDGELDPDEVKQLQAHLLACERCTADLARYRELDWTLGRLDRPRAPRELRQSLYERLEQRQRATSRRSWTNALRGPVFPLATTCLLAAGAIGAWRLLPVGTAPVMTAAFAVQETPESLDGVRVELVFDRPVAADSVAAAVAVSPPLPLDQKIHENKVELIPQVGLVPGGSYAMVVSNVRDRGGNVQTEPIRFRLLTEPRATLIQESSPAELPPTVAPRLSEPAILINPGATGGTALVALLDGIADLQARLGAAKGAERAVQLSEQAFQGGAMLRRADGNQVFALIRSNNRWSSYGNTWRPGEVLASAGARPPGTLEPLRGFGKVWREQPAVKLELGWPVYDERAALGSFQSFAHGTLVRSAYGVVYALLDDGTWRTLPDGRR